MAAFEKGVKERRCILTGEALPSSRLIRLVMAPDGELVPDLAEKLPGRGCWVTASRKVLDAAISDGSLCRKISRSLKTKVTAHATPGDLGARIEALMSRRWLERLGLERKSGRLALGHDQVRAALKAGKAHLLLEASDAAPDTAKKMRALATAIGSVPVVALFDREELGLALGRDNVVHAALLGAGSASRLAEDAEKLGGIRAGTALP